MNRRRRRRKRIRAGRIVLIVTLIIIAGVLAEVAYGASAIRARRSVPETAAQTEAAMQNDVTDPDVQEAAVPDTDAAESGAPAVDSEDGQALPAVRDGTGTAATEPDGSDRQLLERIIPGLAAGPAETEPETPAQPEIDPSRPMVALTFDDGPLAENTSRLLDILRENGAHATFFVVGYALDGNEEIVRRAYEEGNEIASHTLNHPHLRNLGDAELDQEIGGMRQRIVDITGQQTVLLRPPYGETDEHVMAHITDPVILWSVDTRDWAERDVESIFGHVQNDTFDGAILLMHDIHSTTIDAAEVFIPWLREQGYQMVTVSELGQYREEGGLQAGVRYGAFRPAETEAPETEASAA